MVFLITRSTDLVYIHFFFQRAFPTPALVRCFPQRSRVDVCVGSRNGPTLSTTYSFYEAPITLFLIQIVGTFLYQTNVPRYAFFALGKVTLFPVQFSSSLRMSSASFSGVLLSVVFFPLSKDLTWKCRLAIVAVRVATVF